MPDIFARTVLLLARRVQRIARDEVTTDVPDECRRPPSCHQDRVRTSINRPDSEPFFLRARWLEMDEKPPRDTPIGYEDAPDKVSKSAFKISGLAIAAAAVICLALIALVVARSGGI